VSGADVDDRYGGVEAYLTGQAGVAPADLDTLRGRLVDLPGGR
jgi:hypothetical protein